MVPCFFRMTLPARVIGETTLKQRILAVIAVFVAWSVLDFVIHGIFLQPTYQATAHLWRPIEEMNVPLMYIISLVYAACFVFLYEFMISDKSLRSGIRFGALFGFATGISMGFGSYSFMPIPLSLAFVWFLGTWLSAAMAGGIVGAIFKSHPLELR